MLQELTPHQQPAGLRRGAAQQGIDLHQGFVPGAQALEHPQPRGSDHRGSPEPGDVLAVGAGSVGGATERLQGLASAERQPDRRPPLDGGLIVVERVEPAARGGADRRPRHQRFEGAGFHRGVELRLGLRQAPTLAPDLGPEERARHRGLLAGHRSREEEIRRGPLRLALAEVELRPGLEQRDVLGALGEGLVELGELFVRRVVGQRSTGRPQRGEDERCERRERHGEGWRAGLRSGGVDGKHGQETNQRRDGEEGAKSWARTRRSMTSTLAASPWSSSTETRLTLGRAAA